MIAAKATPKDPRGSWLSDPKNRGLYTRDGKYGHKYTDPATGKPVGPITLRATTKTAAKAEIVDRMARINRGEVAVPSKVTLNDVADDYFAMLLDAILLGGNNGTYKNDESKWRNHIQPTFGHRAVQDITPRAVAVWVRERRKAGVAKSRPRGYSEWYLHGMETTLACIMNVAISRGIIMQSPTRRMAKGERAKQQTQKKNQILTPEQLVALQKAITPCWKNYLITSMFCGTRASEPLGLQFHDIDFPTNKINLTQQISRTGGRRVALKTGEGGKIDMPAEVREALLEQYNTVANNAPGAWVFPTETGGPQNVSNASRALRKALKKAGIVVDEDKRLAWHALRKTLFSALMSNPEIQLPEIQKLGRWTDSAVLLNNYVEEWASRSQRRPLGERISETMAVQEATK